jgi:hypothetical protein
MEEKELLRTQTELIAHANNARIELSKTREESNEQAIRRILEFYPGLHNRLVALQNRGYVVSYPERNALIVSAVKDSVLSLEAAIRQEKTSRRKMEELRQKDLFKQG